jgi:arylsulfatase A-like enzyme
MSVNYIHRVKALFRLLVFLLLLFFLSRLFFYFYNYFIFAGNGFVDLLKLFVAGIRFDLPVIIYLNIPIILVFIFPYQNPLHYKPTGYFLRGWFVVVNSLLILIDLSDGVFFHFTQKRSTADIFNFLFLSDDIKVLLPGFIKNYWFVPLLWIFSIIILWKVYAWLLPEKVYSPVNKINKKTFGFQFAAFLLLIALFIVGGRGGLQLKPVTIIDASKHASAENIPLVLNTPFSIMTTFGQTGITPRQYFTDEKAQSVYPVLHKYGHVNRMNQKNIVVLLLESFSKEYVGYFNHYKGYTPFLDSLIAQALVFDNAFSNGLRSIDAIPAIVSGIPALMNEALITSVYSSNKMLSLPEILKSKGYYTAFFHGGTNGTMNFDGFASHAGFDDYFGRYEYNNDNDYDGTWGIYDEPFLQYVANKLNSVKQPFFAFEFTLSSHYPYKLPEKYVGKFKEGPLKIHKVISYADHSLKRFFETASKMPWYKNTLFVICADHPAQSVIPNDNNTYEENTEKLPLNKMAFYNNLTGKYAIPLIFYAPGDTTIRGVMHQTIQQSDIFPALLHYLNVNNAFVAFGQSIYDTAAPQVAFQFYNGIYQLTQYPYSLEFDGNKTLALYNNETDLEHSDNLLLKQPEKVKKLEQIIKAVLQQYSERLRENRLADTVN